MTMAGGHNSRGEFFQREWSPSELANDPHINLLETRAAKESILSLSNPGDKVRLHIDNRVACCYIARQGGTKVLLCVRRPALSGRD